MIQSSHPKKLTGAAALAITAAAALTGCSTHRSGYLQDTDPGVSPYAVASADEGAYVAEPFSLIAADSIGLATFGAEIAQSDTRYEREAYVDVR